MMKVRNMINESGRNVVNQFIIEEGTKTAFQSYDSPIIEIDRGNGVITVYPDYNYSRTTGKYRNLFMRQQGFYDMENLKGFEYYMNLGAIGNYDIVKAN